MNTHEACSLFPDMGEEEFASLVEDIRANGQREPILLAPDGSILDGRHRWRACERLGIGPKTVAWDGEGDPFDLVISLNLHRRHLNPSQRAMVADRLATCRQGERRDGQPSAHVRKVDHADAAKALSVSPRSVEGASVVRRDGVPELVELVEKGRVSVKAAEEVARMPREEQVASVKAGPKAVQQRAVEARRRRKYAPKPGAPAPKFNPPPAAANRVSRVLDAVKLAASAITDPSPVELRSFSRIRDVAGDVLRAHGITTPAGGGDSR